MIAGAQQGSSLPEVLVAMVLLLLVVTGLTGYHQGIYRGLDRWQDGIHAWLMLEGQLEDPPAPIPAGWQRHNRHTPEGGCIRREVALVSPQGRQAMLSALHCR